MEEFSEYLEYLGEGVYVKYDGYGFWILANDHMDPTDKIYLEPHNLAALNRFVDNLKRRKLNDLSN